MKGIQVLQWQVTETNSWMLNSILKCRSLTLYIITWDKAAHNGKFLIAAMYKEMRGESVDVP